MWGIGRELYEFPTIFAKLKDGEAVKEANGRYKMKVYPKDWKWTFYQGKLAAKDRNDFGRVMVDMPQSWIDSNKESST